MEKTIQVQVPFEYELSEGDPSRLLVFLHGYQLNGRWMMKRFRDLEFAGRVVAPNGPFPVPYRAEAGWMMTYGWYLFDPERGKYFIEMDRAVEFLRQGLREWLEPAEDVYIVGFSQGGYLAPFLALAEAKVRQVVGVGCRFRSEKLTDTYSFRLDAIHGARDRAVDPERSKKCLNEILSHGNSGEFVEVDDLGHDVDERVVQHLQQLLSP